METNIHDHTNSSFIKWAVILVGFVLAFVAAFLAISAYKSALTQNAVTKCASISQYQQINKTTGVTVSYPVEEVYTDCLKKAGVQ